MAGCSGRQKQIKRRIHTNWVRIRFACVILHASYTLWIELRLPFVSLDLHIKQHSTSLSHAPCLSLSRRVVHPVHLFIATRTFLGLRAVRASGWSRLVDVTIEHWPHRRPILCMNGGTASARAYSASVSPLHCCHAYTTASAADYGSALLLIVAHAVLASQPVVGCHENAIDCPRTARSRVSARRD